MLIDNILFLREHYPEIRHYFSQYESDLQLDQWEVLKSRSGNETIRYLPNDGNPCMVHSMYDPIREAERVITSHQEKINENTHVFFFGIGMGYHIKKFTESFPNNSYSLYEPIPEVFFEMTKRQDLKNIITKNTRNVYIDTYKEKSIDYLEEFNTTNQIIHLIVLPSYKNIAKEKYEIFHKQIKDMILNRRTELHTNARFQKRWVTNSLINFETVLKTPNMMRDIDRSHFEGKPAIIVSAGPSLAEDMEHLRYIKENNLAYIFSVGSAINALIEYDVLPDAVFTYDPQEKNQKVFKKMIDIGIDHIPMVFGSSVGYETIVKYKGPKVHFITSQDRTSLYFLRDQLNLEHDLIMDSPSIAVMTFQILNKLGLDPIIFTGQNLGYLNDQIYSKGIKYDYHTSEFIQKRLKNTILTENVYGHEIKTNLTFNSMRNSIENFAKVYQGKTFINTTKGGAKIEGVPFKPIEKVIEKFLTNSLVKCQWWVKANNYNKQGIGDQLENLKNNMKDFSKILVSFQNIINSISINVKIGNDTKILNDLTEFDKLFNRLIDNKYYNDFLSYYIRTHVKYLTNEIKLLNVEPNTLVKGKKIVPLFNQFLDKCYLGHLELERLINRALEYEDIK